MRLKSRLMRPRPIRRVGATFVASLITLPPLQHPQCPEGVPAAGLTEAFELEERLPLVAVLQRPATVGHLLLQQVFGKSIETFIVILEVRQDGEHHAGNACLAPTPPFSPDAVVDPAVLLEPSVKEETAGLPCLPVARQQAKVTEQQ